MTTPATDPYSTNRRLNPRPRHRPNLINVLREILNHQPKPEPEFSVVFHEVKLRCPWSRFSYERYHKFYLPRFRKGAL